MFDKWKHRETQAAMHTLRLESWTWLRRMESVPDGRTTVAFRGNKAGRQAWGHCRRRLRPPRLWILHPRSSNYGPCSPLNAFWLREGTMSHLDTSPFHLGHRFIAQLDVCQGLPTLSRLRIDFANRLLDRWRMFGGCWKRTENDLYLSEIIGFEFWFVRLDRRKVY